MKESFKGDIVPAIHPDSVRVRLIAKDIIEALQRGLSHEVTWTDVDYASGKVDPAHEGGGGKDTLMALHDAPEQGKWSREDEILDDQWIEKSRKTSWEERFESCHFVFGSIELGGFGSGSACCQCILLVGWEDCRLHGVAQAF
ncbi:unnamed protein product [Malus baccata var. baccata]